MSLTDDLYREIILEHFRSPRNHGRLDKPTLTAQGANPFCGDELQLMLVLNGDQVADIRFEGKGCSISQSSASMMTEAIKGKPLQEAEQIAKKFKSIMLEGADVRWPSEMEDLASLEGVKKYPVRIKCAILSWNTLLEGLAAYRKGLHDARHTEGEEGEHPSLAQIGGMEPAAAPADVKPAEESQEQVRNALKSVIDPELNMNIVDLGLIYGIDVQGPAVKITYTLTSPGCPLGPVIKGQIHSCLTRLPWVKGIQDDLVWAPPWDPHTMASDEAKTELGIW